MSPKLFEVTENGRLTLTAHAYMVEEVKDILDKYELDAEPYIAYCDLMSNFTSPFRNYPEIEKRELAIREVHVNIGAFDEDEPLLPRCVERLKEIYSSPLVRFYEELEEELSRLIYYMKTTPITSDDYAQRAKLIENAGKLAASYAATKKQIDEELKANTKGTTVISTIR